MNIALTSLFGILLLASEPILEAAQPASAIVTCTCSCPKQKNNAYWNTGKNIALAAGAIYLGARIGGTHLPKLASRLEDINPGLWANAVFDAYDNILRLTKPLWYLSDCCRTITTKTESSVRCIFGIKNNES